MGHKKRYTTGDGLNLTDPYVQSLAGQNSNKRTRKSGKALSNKDLIEMDFSQRQLQQKNDFTEYMYNQYQSPQAMMRQYSEAGLNPALMYEGAGSGSPVQSNSEGGMSLGNTSEENPSSVMSAISSIFTPLLNAIGLKSEIDERNANVLTQGKLQEVYQSEISKNGAEEEAIRQGTKKSKQEYDYFESVKEFRRQLEEGQVTAQKYTNEVLSYDAEILRQTKEVKIDMATAEYDLTVSQKKYYDSLKDSIDKKLPYEIRNIQSQTDLNKFVAEYDKYLGENEKIKANLTAFAQSHGLPVDDLSFVSAYYGLYSQALPLKFVAENGGHLSFEKREELHALEESLIDLDEIAHNRLAKGTKILEIDRWNKRWDMANTIVKGALDAGAAGLAVYLGSKNLGKGSYQPISAPNAKPGQLVGPNGTPVLSNGQGSYLY